MGPLRPPNSGYNGDATVAWDKSDLSVWISGIAGKRKALVQIGPD